MKEDEFDILNKIERVEAPPFLFTRIEQRIKNLSGELVRPKWVWAIGLGLVLLLGTNMAILSKRGTTSEHADLLKELSLSPDNLFYTQ